MYPIFHASSTVIDLDGAVRIELVEGVPIFHASSTVIERIETLIARDRESSLTEDEENELDGYEGLDDYLSLINRIMCNVSLNPNQT